MTALVRSLALLAGMTVLCIDNERSILDGMRTLLEGWGCRVLTASNLAEALAAVEGSGAEPDGFLVDYHLDAGNGIGAIAELRRRHNGAPAILITADRTAAVREAATAEGVHFLNKPLKPASLRALMTQWRVQRVAAERSALPRRADRAPGRGRANSSPVRSRPGRWRTARYRPTGRLRSP